MRRLTQASFGAIIAAFLLSSCAVRLGGSALPPPAAAETEAARRDAVFASADAFFSVWLQEKMTEEEKAVLNGMANPMAVVLHDADTGWRREWAVVPSEPGRVEVAVDAETSAGFRFALDRALFMGIVSGEKGSRDAMAAFRSGAVLVELNDNPAGLLPLLRMMLDFIGRHPYR